MKLRKTFFLILMASVLAAQNTEFVNPMIGTGGHGHTFPGAVVPFGMVQLSPDTRKDGSWDGCSGYHYSDARIYGFSHTHLSGTGCSDWGDVLLMPTTGTPNVDPAQYASSFKHENEKASPGYYEVQLDDDNIKAQLTVTPRVGIHKYTFGRSGEGNVVLDLLHRDKTLECTILMYDSVTVYGYRYSEAWAKNQKVYYAMRFSKPFKRKEIANQGKFIAKYGKFKIQPEQGVFIFDLPEDKSIMVKLAISPVSLQGALANLNAEAPHWDFEKYRMEAKKMWDQQLSKIEISESNPDKRTVFYTALYHACIHPSLSMDVDGQYRGRDDKIHKAEGFTNYSVFSLWDTYRALHPLFTIIEQKRTNDFINSFLQQYKQSGRLPVWELSSNETDCMIGFHSVSVIADALSKGIDGFDKGLAFEAAKAAANYSAFSIPEFNRKGFLEVDDESESVSKTLEYAYDNWCVGQIARLTANAQEADLFFKRSLGYMNLFDPTTGFMRPRKNGNWLSPFYPNEINNHFTEGNSWQYSFYAPHDVSALINMHGGKENFEKKLDELFLNKEKTRGREQADVTGLIGQYAHGNEPSHHMAYLYNFADRPEKTRQWVHQICDEFYKNSPDGLIGNEDCGQMSAWYVLSSMGMYPLCPGTPRYILTVPIFNSTKVNFENGKSMTIKADYAKGKKWTGLSYNEKELIRTELQHSALMAGGVLEFRFDQTDGKVLSPPSTAISNLILLRQPVIDAPAQVFRDKQTLSIKAFEPGTQLIYSINGHPFLNYTAPFVIDSNCTVAAKTVLNSDTSLASVAHYYKVRNNFELKIVNPLNSQYSADGPQTLVDGIEPGTNWRKGNWLGVQGKDFECIVDMKKNSSVSMISLFCLQDTNSWIIFPSSVEYFGSKDGKKFVPLGTVSGVTKADDYTLSTQHYKLNVQSTQQFRFLKIVAKQYGALPEWHAGKGGASFIFAGELDIR